jgi:uncharacterized protein
MKRSFSAFLILTVALAVSVPCMAAEEEKEFEMTLYYMVLLYRGPEAAKFDATDRQKIQAGHMANIEKMAADGKLLLAGPFDDDTDLRGIFVLTVGSMKEAEELVKGDPAVKAGRLRYEIPPWYAAKNIKVYATAADVPK